MATPRRSTKDRLRAVVLGIREAVLPTRPLPEPQEPPSEDADVHAAGHHHVGPPPEQAPPAAAGPPPGRPWTRNLRRWGQVHHKARG